MAILRPVLRPILSPILGGVLTPRAVTLLYDSCTDTDATAIASHAPELGGPWTARNGTWAVQGNKIRNTGARPALPRWIATAPAAANVRYEADIALGASGGGGLVFRYSDNTNMWFADLDAVGNLVTIVREQAAGFTTLASVAFTFAAQTYHLAVVARGAAIDVFVDGSAVASYASATFNQTATACGLRVGPNVTTEFDNLTITAV